MGMSELEDTATIKSLQLRTDVAAANADGSCLCLTGESNIMSGVAFDDVIFSYENIFYGSRKKKVLLPVNFHGSSISGKINTY